MPRMTPQAKCATANWVRGVSPKCTSGAPCHCPKPNQQADTERQDEAWGVQVSTGITGETGLLPWELSTMAWWEQMRQKEAEGEGGKQLPRTGIAAHVVFCKDASVRESGMCRSWHRKTEDLKFCMLSFLRIGHVVGRWKGDVYNEQKIPLARASRMCRFPDMILSVLSTLPPLLPSVDMLWSHPSRMQQPPSSQATGETKWSSEARARG